MNISYSALNTFQNCPLKYKFQNIERIKTSPSKEAVFGTILHSALNFLHQPRPLPPTLEELLEFYNNSWNSEVYEDKQEEMAIMQQGIRILEDYYRTNNPKNFKIIDLETFFSVPIGKILSEKDNPAKEEIILSGKIDRIDQIEGGGLEIIDYKTSKNLPPQEVVNNDLQLAIYQMGTQSRWPTLNKPIKLSLYFLKHGIKLSSVRTPEQIKQVKERLLDLVKEIKTSDFNPTPTPLCGWCGYQQECPMFKHKFKQEKSEIHINEVIKEYYELKEESKKTTQKVAELQKLINQYCDEQKIERVFSNPENAGDNITITRTVQKRYDYDADKIKSVLEPLNKWAEIISIDSAKLKKLAATLPYHEKRKIEEAKKIKSEYAVLKVSRKK
jgi:RecB family exonuclease